MDKTGIILIYKGAIDSMDKEAFLKHLQSGKFTVADAKKINSIFGINDRVQFTESVYFLLKIEDGIFYSRLKPSEKSLEKIEEYIYSTKYCSDIKHN